MLPSARSDWLAKAVTSSFQLRIEHRLKHWIVDFLIFEMCSTVVPWWPITTRTTYLFLSHLGDFEKDPDPDPRLKHLLKSIMAEEAVKMQLYGIETGFPILYSTPPSDGDACSGGKIRVNEPNSDLCPCLESKTVEGDQIRDTNQISVSEKDVQPDHLVVAMEK
uniref:Uncharacterized protein n=1 Tax=Vitis vinifera TaxID=29760 RepID=A5C453_VITVI|nr:hypothetical protein VITISV_019076 [Vitis vinifera]